MNSVIKGASYVLAHTPQMVVYNGTTQTTERIVNPESEYLKELEGHLRSYEDCVNYWPNQVYIGNATPEELAEVEFPYYDKVKDGAERYGKYGEIMPEEEFLLLVQACDQFEVVMLDKEFVSAHKDALAADPIITDDIVERIHEGVELAVVEAAVNEEHAEGLYIAGKLVGCVKRAHDIDVGASYVLAHTPQMVVYNGTTQTTERIVNPESEYLKELEGHLRSYEDCVNYWPNQVYIGNATPEELAEVEFPYYDKVKDGAERYGKYGEIMPEEEFLLLVQACDQFEVVMLDKEFVSAHKDALAADPIITDDIVERIHEGVELAVVEAAVNEEHAEGLYIAGKLVGCVKRAHDIDVNLSAHVMHENLMSKASSVLALLYGVKNAGISKDDVEYVIDCAEEACGDMNQRGGGNFAKAAAEIAMLNNATGSDSRGFCAGPSHALIEAAALVKSGAYKCVAVTAGGCTAKLGMNGKDHVKKGLPILEDCLAGFCVIVAENDGENPEINLDILGRHTVGTGSAPQNVIGSLVADPLERAGLKITDIDKFSPEMQNPDITKPAGAGDVPMANYKMIAALAVKRGELDRKELASFTTNHGLTGWAPTQGHIPSGVPYIGFAREDILAGKINKAMIIGKGSLFLGRMTNLFDGVSFVIQANTKAEAEAAAGVSEEEVKGLIAKAMKDFAASLIAE